MEIVVELYVRGFEAGVLLLCSGLEEEKGCQNNSCVPTRGQPREVSSYVKYIYSSTVL